jgi:hypothetical protein
VAYVLFSHPELVSSAVAAEVQAASEQRAAIQAFREEVDTSFRAVKNETETWRTATQTDVAGLLDQNKKAFAEEHKEQSETFSKSHSEWTVKATNLENLYREKLRLEEPAKYWSELEDRYLKQGRLWIAGAAIVVFALAGWVSVLVYQPPAFLNSEKFTLGGVKGAILIAGGISAFLYLMNLFVKVATSSYHLARDARERYQLTHVFLALIKDGAIEAKDREVVLSALFSRSDTGLLKNDSGPTLPTPLGSFLDHFRNR